MVTKAHLNLAARLKKPPMNTVINDTLMEIIDLLFTEEEAQVTAAFPMMPASAKKMAKRLHRPEREVKAILENLCEKRLILSFGEGSRKKYMMLPIVPGIFETQMSTAPRDEKAVRFAELFEEYFVKENFEEMNKRTVSMVKVVPVQKTVENTIGAMPGDQMREAIERQEVWGLADACSCRHHKELVGDSCDRPKDVCMSFGKMAEYTANYGVARLVSKEEILEAVDRAEESGLVHITDNVEFPSFSCNCCACCCGFLGLINKFNMPGLVTSSRFIAEVDTDACKSCGKCAKVCPVGALRRYHKKLTFDEWRCIGCGACIAACNKNFAIKMVKRPDPPDMPANYGQLFVQMGTEYLGINKFTEHLPGFTRFFGNRLQNMMTKK